MERKAAFKKVLNAIKPWALYGGLFLILRYSGILSGISTFTHQALLTTGIMNAPVEALEDEKKFDYNFALYDLHQRKIDVSGFKGKTIFLNLWATWCGPCRAEMPSIENLYKKVDRENIVFIMLSLDQKDPFTKVTRYVQEKEFTFPVYFPAGELPATLQVRSIPVTLVISPEGKTVYKHVGTANYDTDKFRSFLEGL